MTKALVILSGGQDSTICLFLAAQQYDEVHAVTFDYNQRHKIEIESAKKVARFVGVGNHEIIELGSILQGRSPLINPHHGLETYSNFDTMDKVIGDRVELTFVPMRNDLFLTLAVNRAVCFDIYDIFTGVCEADNANYPDCRHSYIQQKAYACNYALGLENREVEKIRIHTPLITTSKAESIKIALTLPGCYTALGYTHTAYSSEYPPLTQDHATVLRAHGFEEAGIPDPLIVRAYLERKIHVIPFTDNYLKYESCLLDWCDSTFKSRTDPSFVYERLRDLEDIVKD